jgi:predicted metal-dependent hydrolase
VTVAEALQLDLFDITSSADAAPTPKPNAGGKRAGRLLHLGEDGLAVQVRRSRRARRIILRIGPRDEFAELVLPRCATLAEGREFAESRTDWLKERLAEQPPRIPFVDGATVPILGVPYRLRRLAGDRGRVRRKGTEVVVPGDGHDMPRRFEAWLKREARREIAERAEAFAARLGRTVARVQLRDPSSQWASCSARGTLSFSWRLVLAPVDVLDYVVAHEVAHLEVMNHSPRFWRLVEQLCPHRENARDWLRDQGARLHCYG